MLAAFAPAPTARPTAPLTGGVNTIAHPASIGRSPGRPHGRAGAGSSGPHRAQLLEPASAHCGTWTIAADAIS